MTSSHRCFPLFTALATVTAGSLLPGQTYTLYGPACGTPVLVAHDSPLIPGMTTHLTLDGANFSPIAVSVIGLAPLSVPVLGCTLLVSPDVTNLELVDPAGHAEHALSLPGLASIVGLSVYDQWVTFDATQPSGFAFSEAIDAPVTNPQVTVGAFGPNSGGVGTPITLTMGGLGTTDPDNLCVRAISPLGGSSLVRVLSIVPSSPGLATVMGVLATADRLAPVPGFMGAMRGTGATMVPPPGVKLSAPVDGWGWQGAGLPQAGGQAGAFQAIPTQGQNALSFAVVGNSIRASLGAGPFLVNQQITLDVHWDVICPGQPQVHFDHFLGTMTVLANMTALEARDEIAAKVAAVFNTLWPGKVNVNVPVPSGAEIVVTMVDPACTIVGGGGSVYVQ